jgi:hypothetical protein
MMAFSSRKMDAYLWVLAAIAGAVSAPLLYVVLTSITW